MTTVFPIIATRDLDRLLHFYTDLFGGVEFQRVGRFFVGLTIGDGQLGLVAVDDADLDAPQRILINVAVPDVDALLEAVAAAGGKVEGPPNDMPWGQRVAHIQDPDGNA